MIVHYGGHPVVGFGESSDPSPPTTKTASPWPMLIASSVVSAAAGWAIEEVAHKVRKKKKR